MASPPTCDFHWQAPDFALPGTDGKTYTLDGIRGQNGTLVMFICNHCPYVQSIIDQLAVEVSVMQKKGIGCVAINSNDYDAYPDDSFENMQKVSKRYGFCFPYQQKAVLNSKLI